MVSVCRTRLVACAVVLLVFVAARPALIHGQLQNEGRADEALRTPGAKHADDSTRSAAIPNRIPQAIDPAHTYTLANHHPLWANPHNDVGLASSEMTLTLVLARSPQQQKAFDSLVADQQNPASPQYHLWLTPAEVGSQFGLSDADIEAIKGWLQSQGLTVSWVSPSRNFIGFAGTAANVGRTFQTEIHTYRVHGAQRTSVASDPVIPAALAGVIKAVDGLYTVEERPTLSMHPGRLAVPELTLPNGNHFIVPLDFQNIYDGIVSYDGYGETIGIVGRSRTDFADFNNFRQLTLSNFQTPTEIVPTAFGGVDPGPPLTAPPPGGGYFGDQGEATLDVERSGTVAQNSNLLLVIATAASGGIGVDAQYLIQTSPLPAQVINVSFVGCESEVGPAATDYWDALMEQAAAEGISVFVASGDSGASGCDAAFVPPPATPLATSPNALCSSSYVTCVGGTEFNDVTNPSQYWGSNGTNLASALKYIPEGGWNEPGTASNPEVASSGGGMSAYIATPSWQTGTGVPGKSGRYTPDVSFASSCRDGYFGCYAAGNGDCVTVNGGFSFEYFCGTSAAAPSMAGVAALLDQKLGFAQGNLNPELYRMAQTAPASFHDTTVATSGVTNCSANTPSLCNNSIPGLNGSPVQAGYLVTNGYDLVTGLGSLDVANFLNNFASPYLVPTVTVQPSATSITAVQPLTVTITVAGVSGQPDPTGSVTLTCNTYNSGATALINGAATIVIAGGSIPGSIDVQTLNAEYVPDAASSAIYRAVTGTATVAVTLIDPTVTVQVSATQITTAQVLTVAVNVAGGGGNPVPTGTVGAITVATTGLPYYTSSPLASGVANVTIPAGVLPPGVNRVDAKYMPDQKSGAIYDTAIGSSSNVTVTQAPKSTPGVTVTPASPAITAAQPLTVTVAIVPGTGGPPASGTVTLKSGIYTSTPAVLANGGATIVVPAGGLAVATDTLTVTYSGDYNYNAATGTSTVAVNKAMPAVTLTTPSSSITALQPLTVTVAVNGTSGNLLPFGTVTLTSGSYNSGAVTLNGGLASITIPAGGLATGADTLTADYSGDANYTPASATSSIMVTATFSVGGTAVTISSPGAITGNTSTITVTPAGGFTGNVMLTAQITSSPAGAQKVPTFNFGTSNAVSVTDANPVTATLTVTTLATATALVRRDSHGNPWYAAGGGALACIILFGIPGRQRSLRARLGLLAFFAALSSGITACSGGGGGSGGGNTIPGTTAGTYVVTVTGASGSISVPTTINVIVQ